MIEILDYKKIDKGALQYIISVKVSKWHLVINKIGVFTKENSRWLSLPQEKYESNGETKFSSLVRFDDAETFKRFQTAVLQELDKKTK